MVKIKDGFQGSRAIVLPGYVIAEMQKDSFALQLYITDIGYFPLARHHYMTRPAGARQYVLIYCVDGEGWIDIYGCHFVVKANTFFIIPPEVPHAYGAEKSHPWTIYWLHFSGANAGFFATGFDTPTLIQPSEKSRIMDRINVFEEIFRILQNGFSIDNLYYAISSLYYFLGSIKYIGKFRESERQYAQSKDLVEKVVAFMKEHVEGRLKLKQIAEYARCSESYLNVVFKNQTGYSPQNFFIQLKVQEACRLLDFTEMKINQVCYKVGIEDPYYFSRVFSKLAGCSPTKYRNRKKG